MCSSHLQEHRNAVVVTPAAAAGVALEVTAVEMDLQIGFPMSNRIGRRYISVVAMSPVCQLAPPPMCP